MFTGTEMFTFTGAVLCSPRRFYVHWDDFMFTGREIQEIRRNQKNIKWIIIPETRGAKYKCAGKLHLKTIRRRTWPVGQWPDGRRGGNSSNPSTSELYRRPKALVAVPICVCAHGSGTPLTRFVAPQGAPPKAPLAGSACVRALRFGTPFIRFVAPQGATPKAPVARSTCAPTPHFGTPLTRFLIPLEVPQKAPVAGSTCVRAPRLGTSLTRFVAPWGALVAGPTCARALHFGTPLTRSGPHRELHRRNLLQGPHAFPPLTSVHPSHASRPNSELDRRPQWQGPRVSPPLISAHPSRLSWPHKELHRRPQWQGSHASAPLIPARPSHACFVALRSPYKDLVIRQPPPIHATMRPVLSAARCLWRGPVPTVFVICSPSYFQGEPPEFARRPHRCSHWDTDSVLCSRGSRGRTSRGNCPLRSEAWQGSQPTADHHGRPWQTTAARQTTGTQEHGRPAMQITRSRQTNTSDARDGYRNFGYNA